MKFSICIPNYNYGRYIEETIRSALDQACVAEIEVHVADNASTDDSAAVVRGIGDPRISIDVNRWNVGFAGNLDRACAHASGDWMILLSSDDLVLPGALSAYEKVIAALGDRAGSTILCASQHVVDGESRQTGRMDHDPRLWKGAVRDEALSAAAGAPCWLIPTQALLANSLRNMRNPFHFATTCYPRGLYEAVEGYAGARGIGPDKHFAWKAMTAGEWAVHVETPLFAYRVHNANQGAQQAQSGALKHLSDQYAFAFDTAPEILAKGGISREELAAAFVHHDIALRGLKLLAEGKRIDARRYLRFGQAAYPALVAKSREALALRALLLLGPLGTVLARAVIGRALAKFKAA